MAYYMAVRRGSDSLMDRRLPQSAMLPPEILQPAIRGLMALREVELNETHRLIFEPKGSHPCSASNCPSRTPTSTATLDGYRKIFDHMVGPSQAGTKVLQVPEFHQDRGGGSVPIFPDLCSSCVERWKVGHADLRKKVWATLPSALGLRSCPRIVS